MLHRDVVYHAQDGIRVLLMSLGLIHVFERPLTLHPHNPIILPIHPLYFHTLAILPHLPRTLPLGHLYPILLPIHPHNPIMLPIHPYNTCIFYTYDPDDDLLRVDPDGRRIIKKQTYTTLILKIQPDTTRHI